MDYRINYAGMDVVFKINDIQNSYLRECVLGALKCFYGHFLQNVGEQPVAMTYRLTDHIDDHFDKNANNVSMTEAAKINDYQCFLLVMGIVLVMNLQMDYYQLSIIVYILQVE